MAFGVYDIPCFSKFTIMKHHTQFVCVAYECTQHPLMAIFSIAEKVDPISHRWIIIIIKGVLQLHNVALYSEKILY